MIMSKQTSTAITAHTMTLASRVRVSPEVLLQEIGGESVLLDTASENYFGLNSVGTHIWRLLDGGTDLRTVCDTVLAEYDVPTEQLEHDVIALVGQLADAGLVTIA